MDEFSQLLASLSPEDLDQLFSLSTSGDQMGLAQQGYQRGMGLQDQPMQPHSTFAGGLLGGLSQGAGNLVGGLQMNKAQGQMQGLLQQRPQVLQRLARLLQQPASASPMGDFDADDTGGMMG